MTHEHTIPVTIGTRPLHPRHGLHAPRQSTSARRPGSIRRTISIDTVRPGDLLGDVVQYAVLRDLHTAADGSATVRNLVKAHSRIDYPQHYRLLELDAEPAREELQQLIGRSVSTGFRAAVAALIPDDIAQATPLYSLLDDMPGAALVSGFALGAAGRNPEFHGDTPRLQIENLCAGFRTGGTIINNVNEHNRSPVVTGPVAPEQSADDPLAYHEMREMGPHDVRRLRRLDVMPGETPEAPVTVEAYFRDSHTDPAGVHTIIHEYTVLAEVDPVAQAVIRSSATAHTLPWLECIEAEASGDRLAGRPLRGIRPNVREELVGITTCTHLNDTLRSFEDVRAILQMF